MKPDELQCAAFCASRCTLEFLFYLKQKYAFCQVQRQKSALPKGRLSSRTNPLVEKRRMLKQSIF